MYTGYVPKQNPYLYIDNTINKIIVEIRFYGSNSYPVIHITYDLIAWKDHDIVWVDINRKFINNAEDLCDIIQDVVDYIVLNNIGCTYSHGFVKLQTYLNNKYRL